jgi:TetR/AcrR family transcriptional repressor of nem operon
MKVSREQREANRGRILEAAGGLFREKGFDAVSVAEVMKVAGLTHGGFYGHFESKDDLIVQTIAHIFGAGPPETGPGGLEADLDAYLSPLHRDGVADGCPTAALVADVRRQTPAARAAMTEGFRSQVDRIARAISREETPEAHRQAVGILASMVGALILSRTIEDPSLSLEILRETRAWIGDRAARPPTGGAG